MNFTELFAILCIFGIPLSIPLVSIWTKHQREMLQLRLRLRQGEGNSHADVEALRQELRALRETALQYDLSFDAALQRLEQRVSRIEPKAAAPQMDTVIPAPDLRFGSLSENAPTVRPVVEAQEAVLQAQAGR